MTNNALSHYEACRLADLHELNVLDTPADPRLDSITQFAASLFNAKIALVSLVDQTRQWFKSKQGLNASETTRDIAFCNHAIREDSLMIVENALEDARFLNNPLVNGPPHIRFYAGAVLFGNSGYPLGTLCIIDDKPRELDDGSKAMLLRLAALANKELLYKSGETGIRHELERELIQEVAEALPNYSRIIRKLERALKKPEQQFTVSAFALDHYREFVIGLSPAEQKLVHLEVFDRLKSLSELGWEVGMRGEGRFIAFIPQDLDRNALCEQLFAPFSTPLSVRNHVMTVSAGVAHAPQHGQNAEILCHKACSAKPFNPIGAPSVLHEFEVSRSEAFSERLNIANRLRFAIDNDALNLVYQPKFNLNSGSLCGAEALLRWHDDELGPVSPALFIPIAEESDTILALSNWVLNEACAQISYWDERGLYLSHLAVNLTARELRRTDFIDWITKTIKTHRIAPLRIQFEITERSLLSDIATVRENMEKASKLGFSFALDDFGTGYSSLAELHRLPIDHLKIDQCFIKDLPHSKEANSIVMAILSMTQTLGIATVAEGIEEQAQLDFLKDARCEIGQGYLLGKPCDARSFSFSDESVPV